MANGWHWSAISPLPLNSIWPCFLPLLSGLHFPDFPGCWQSGQLRVQLPDSVCRAMPLCFCHHGREVVFLPWSFPISSGKNWKVLWSGKGNVLHTFWLVTKVFTKGNHFFFLVFFLSVPWKVLTFVAGKERDLVRPFAFVIDSCVNFSAGKVVPSARKLPSKRQDVLWCNWRVTKPPTPSVVFRNRDKAWKKLAQICFWPRVPKEGWTEGKTNKTTLDLRSRGWSYDHKQWQFSFRLHWLEFKQRLIYSAREYD